MRLGVRKMRCMSMSDQIRAWLRNTLEERKDLTVQGWADASGVSKSTIFRAMQEDTAFVASTRTLAKLAQAAGVAPPNLSPNGDGPEPGGASMRQPLGEQATEIDMPIRYEVAAGAWREREDYADEPFGYYRTAPIAPYPIHSQWIEKVVGESYNKVLPDGSMIHVVDAIELGYEPRHGDVVVVVRRRAQGAFEERSLKEVRMVSGGLELWPNSWDARYQTPLRLLESDDNFEDVEVLIAAKVLKAYLIF